MEVRRIGGLEMKTVSCRICGEQTMMTSTKLCDRCWELETRIKADPVLARKILEGIEDVEIEILTKKVGVLLGSRLRKGVKQ